MDTKKLVGLRLKEIRKLRKYTQEQLAELVDLDVTTIGKAEQGISTPSMSNLEELAKILDVDIKDFFDFSHLEERNHRKELIKIFDSLPKERQIIIYKIAKSFI